MNKRKESKQNKDGNKNRVAEKNPGGLSRWQYSGALFLILLLSLIAYLPSLHNGFVWDDEFYIKNNSLLNPINLKKIFTNNVLGNYHPFTILILAIEYHFFGLNETGYHTVNLFLHLINIILVFYVVFILSGKAGIALVAALLFGIHPIHVESVAWASELKDLLYTLFFLTSYIFYLKFLKNKKNIFYFISLSFFLFSLLSKAMAASLPVVFVLTDYFIERKANMKRILEKAPFFILAIAFGAAAVAAQKSTGAIDIASFTIIQRIAFACYGFITYLFKLVLPINLSVFYPYPLKNETSIPIQYYAYIIFFLGLSAYIIYSLRFTKKIILGMGFFAITVFLVLQLLPVGSAIMADRYGYISSVGIFYLAGEGFNLLWIKKFKWIACILLFSFTVFFTIKTYARCGVWKNSISLWNDAISQSQIIPIAYVNRANYLRDTKNYDSALKDYNKALELDANFSNAYFNRGTLFMDIKRNDEAIRDLTKAINLNPNYFKAYYNRGVVYYNDKRYEEAISNYSKALSLKPDYAVAYYSRGLAEYSLGKNDIACADLKQSVRFGYKPPAEALNQICK